MGYAQTKILLEDYQFGKALKQNLLYLHLFLVSPVFMDLDNEGSFWIASYLNLFGLCQEWVLIKVYRNMALRM
ncbi:hypothetical protein BFP75_14740 [Maribacter sp. 4G9]|nr:hypothetical protein BFP75_14740 [Maribacter sp. 4G9]